MSSSSESCLFCGKPLSVCVCEDPSDASRRYREGNLDPDVLDEEARREDEHRRSFGDWENA